MKTVIFRTNPDICRTNLAINSKNTVLISKNQVIFRTCIVIFWTYGRFHPERELTAIELENFWFALKSINMCIYF